MTIQINKEDLIELHHNQYLTLSQIADIYNCTWETIRKRLKKFNIEKLPKFERLEKGTKFGHLTVLELSYFDEYRRAVWKCICDCGNIVYLPNGILKLRKQCWDCGCRLNKTHNMARTCIYKIWQGMKSRCNNVNTINYEYYGGRGITYDSRWEKFENFLEDMYDTYKEGLTLERIDNNSDYCRENCVWTTYQEQSFNKTNNVFLTKDNKTQTVTEWANELGISRGKIYCLIDYHTDWSEERILDKAVENS